MRILLRIFHSSFYFGCIICFIALCCGCANVVAPTGGEKDIEPPHPVSFSPQSLSTHFKSREVKISFDEFFTLNNPSSEIYLSPVANGNLKYKIKHKQLVVTLPDSLKENTTYTLHFGSSVADISEGNKLEGLTYVFSTGDVIDSFRIQGVLKDALTQKPQKGFLVMLYSSADDSVVAKSKPDYFTRTDESGTFMLSYLHGGTYRLFCLNDKNLNYLYDQSNEEIAFMDTLIQVNDATDFYSLYSFLPEEKKTVLTSVANSDNRKAAFAFNHPVKDFHPEIISDSSQILFQSHNRNSDTLFVWFATKQKDSVYFRYELNGVADTAGIRIKSSSAQKVGMTNKFSMRTNLTGIKNNYTLSSERRLEFFFNYPLQKVSKDLLPEIRNDSTKEIDHALLLMKQDSLTGFPYSVLTYEFAMGSSYTVTVPKNYFADVFSNTNDSLLLHFKKSNEISTGNLQLTITNHDSAHHYFAELVSGNAVLRKWQLVAGKNVFVIPSITPSTYRLRFIRDENGNDKWDAGNYWMNQQPEKVSYAAKDIVIRANWDMEAEAEINNSKSSTQFKGSKK